MRHLAVDIDFDLSDFVTFMEQVFNVALAAVIETSGDIFWAFIPSATSAIPLKHMPFIVVITIFAGLLMARKKGAF